MSVFISEDFLNMEVLPDDRLNHEGLFYNIPYFHSQTLWTCENQRNLLVVYEIKNKSSYCPLRIDIKIIDEDNFYIYVYNQSNDNQQKRILIGKENSEFITEIVNCSSIKLSELL